MDTVKRPRWLYSLLEHELDHVVEYFEPFCGCAGPRVYNFIEGHRHCCKCGRLYADD